MKVTLKRTIGDVEVMVEGTPQELAKNERVLNKIFMVIAR